jgi:hypothetical protein
MRPLLYISTPAWAPDHLVGLSHLPPLPNRYVRTYQGCRSVSPHWQLGHAKAQEAALSLLAWRYHIRPLSPSSPTIAILRVTRMALTVFIR